MTGVTPSRERTLEEVKDQVEARFRDDEVAKRLLAKANDIVGKLKAGMNLRSGCGRKLVCRLPLRPTSSAASKQALCQ